MCKKFCYFLEYGSLDFFYTKVKFISAKAGVKSEHGQKYNIQPSFFAGGHFENCSNNQKYIFLVNLCLVVLRAENCPPQFKSVFVTLSKQLM